MTSLSALPPPPPPPPCISPSRVCWADFCSSHRSCLHHGQRRRWTQARGHACWEFKSLLGWHTHTLYSRLMVHTRILGSAHWHRIRTYAQIHTYLTVKCFRWQKGSAWRHSTKILDFPQSVKLTETISTALEIECGDVTWCLMCVCGTGAWMPACGVHSVL